MSAKTFTKLMLAIVACLGLNQLTAPAASAAPLTWTTVVDHAVPSSTNQLRSVALSNDENSIYIGYIQTTGGGRRVYQHDTSSPYGLLNTHVSGNDQPKAIATDDRGNVFVGNRISGNADSFIQSFSSSLSSISSTSAASPVIGGLAVHRIGNDYYAYAAYEGSGLIQRYNITNPLAMTLDTSFGTGGSFNISGGTDLRGIEIASDGTIYVASRDANRVWKVSSDLSSASFVTLNRAMDVAIYGNKLYATSYTGANSLIRSYNLSDLSFVENITISTLDGNPYTRGTAEGWSGIDIDSSGNIWLVDQQYSGSSTSTQDRLLLGASLAVPEPGTVALAGLAAFGFAGMRRRRLGA